MSEGEEKKSDPTESKILSSLQSLSQEVSALRERLESIEHRLEVSPSFPKRQPSTPPPIEPSGSLAAGHSGRSEAAPPQAGFQQGVWRDPSQIRAARVAASPAKESSAKQSSAPAAIPQLKEFLASGSVLNKAGAFTLLICAAYFFKLAIDSGWIGPGARFAIGIFAGLALLGFGEYCVRQKWSDTSSGFLGAGAGILFISIFVGQHIYALFSAEIAFATYLMIVIYIFFQALRYNSEAIAVMGCLGGFLAPALTSNGSGNFVYLALYLLLFDLAVLCLAWVRTWKGLEWVAFIGTELYLVCWTFELSSLNWNHSTSWVNDWFSTFVGVFFLLFAALLIYRSFKRVSDFGESERALAVLNTVFCFGALYIAGDSIEFSLTSLGWCVIAAALGYTVLSLLHSNRLASATVTTEQQVAGCELAFQSFSLMAVGLLVFGIDILAPAHWITILWSVVAILCGWMGTFGRGRELGILSLVILAGVGLRLVFLDNLLEFIPTYSRSVYIPFADRTSVAGLAALLAGLSVLRCQQSRAGSSRRDKSLPGLLLFGLLLLVVRRELHSLVFLPPLANFYGEGERESIYQMSLSGICTLLAFSLYIFGVKKLRSDWSYVAYGLFILTGLKIYLYDLAEVEKIYRVLTLFVFGSVLLGSSYLAQKLVAQATPAPDDPPR